MRTIDQPVTRILAREIVKGLPPVSSRAPTRQQVIRARARDEAKWSSNTLQKMNEAARTMWGRN